MGSAGDEFEQQLAAYRGGIATLEQTRDLSAQIGDRHCVSGIPSLLQMLKHEDPIVRYHAAISLGFELKFRDATDALLGMLARDPDPDCRDAAAGALRVMWKCSKDQNVLKVLVEAAMNDVDEDVRRAAYFALIVVYCASDAENLEILTHERPLVDPARLGLIRAEIGV